MPNDSTQPLVTTQLCDARQRAILQNLKALDETAKATNEKLDRIVKLISEGNGAPPLISAVALNTDARKRVDEWVKEQEDAADDRAQQRKHLNVEMTIAGAGWLVALLLFIFDHVL